VSDGDGIRDGGGLNLSRENELGEVKKAKQGTD
jgi:hypothetical protein